MNRSLVFILALTVLVLPSCGTDEPARQASTTTTTSADGRTTTKRVEEPVASQEFRGIGTRCGTISSFTEANNATAFQLLRQTRSDTLATENVVLSPASINLALSMLLNGADASTLANATRALCLDGKQPEEINRAAQGRIESLNKGSKGAKFTIANSVWTDLASDPSTSLKSTLKQSFKGEHRQFDNADPQASADDVNEWVSSKTKGRIKAILSPDLITSATRMILVNALTMDASWTSPFAKNETRERAFYTDSGSTQVAMMHGTKTSPYASQQASSTQPGINGVRLPYGSSERYGMHVLVPTQNSSADDIARWLTLQTWEQWKSRTKPTRIIVGLPQFTVESSHALKEPLARIGFPMAAWDGLLENPSNTTPLAISNIQHRTWLRVDERGTKAAAATAVIMADSAAPSSKPIPGVIANRPFVMVIDDAQTGEILFTGLIKNPTPAS